MLPDSEIILTSGLHGGYNYSEVKVTQYPDGSPLIKWDGYRYGGYDTMILRPRSIETFVAAMFFAESQAERGKRIHRLIIPHVPGGRQDRLTTGDSLFTVKSVARMINAQSFDQVVVLDPHSYVTPALIDRCKVRTIADVVQKGSFSRTYDGVIAPDAGAAKRAFDVATILKVPFYQAGKHRDVSTGQLSGFSAPDDLPSHGRHLVVDDICDGGGTFVGLSQACDDAMLDLWVTHGIFSKGTDLLLRYYNDIYTTDSIIREDDSEIHVFHLMERLVQWTQ